MSDGYMGFDIAAVSAPIASGQKGFGSGRVSRAKQFGEQYVVLNETITY
jgi:hypothetical protein